MATPLSAWLRLHALFAIVAVSMLVWTWGTWPDPFIDVGRELYLAWRVSEGARLYVDVASFNGPLSPHVNAVWFGLLGVSLRSLVLGNLFLLTLFTPVLYRAALEIGDRVSAVVATLFFIVVFAFGEYDQVGNYNYVTPYSHELVHGLMLAFVSLAALFAYLRTGLLLWLTGSGAALGAVALTKPEVMLAAGGALACAVPLAVWSVEASPERRWRALVIVPTSATLVVGLAVALLAQGTGWEGALRGVLLPYRMASNPAVTGLPFYHALSGRDAPWTAGAAMLKSSLGLLAVMVGSSAGSLLASRYRADVEVLVVSGTFYLITGLMFSAEIVSGVARCWPIVGCCWLVASVRSIARRREPMRHGIARFAWSAFSTLLLLKMFLNVRLYRYGFALAMPATLLVVTTLVSALPSWASRLGGSKAVCRNLSIAAVAILGLLFGGTHRERLVATTWQAGNGRDRFYADNRARPLTAAVHELQTRLRANETVVVLPTGVMLNYLARRRTSVVDVNYMPPELAMFGETSIVGRLTVTPPDYVVLVDVPTQEYGVGSFGRDYGKQIAVWVERHYQQVWSVAGADEDHPPSFAIRLLRRRGASAP